MRYRPNHLDTDLSARLTDDFARAIGNARTSENPNGTDFWVAHTQAGYVYDVLRSMSETAFDGFTTVGELLLLEELMMRVNEYQAELRDALAGETQ